MGYSYHRTIPMSSLKLFEYFLETTERMIYVDEGCLFDIQREFSHMFMVERKWGILS